MYIPPPPLPSALPLSKNRRRGLLLGFLLRGGGGFCTQASENHPTRERRNTLITSCFTCRDCRAMVLNGYALVWRWIKRLGIFSAVSTGVTSLVLATSAVALSPASRSCLRTNSYPSGNRSQTSSFCRSHHRQPSSDMNCVLTLFVSTSCHFMPSFGAEIRKGML